ncbi:MAG: hypothetical protein ACI8QZ_002239 [Chlamydiales bacterium]
MGSGPSQLQRALEAIDSVLRMARHPDDFSDSLPDVCSMSRTWDIFGVVKRFILGAVMGAALSSLRARAGQTLFEFPAASALSSYGMRALALLSCAIALFHARSLFHGRKQNTVLLLGLTAGFGLHGLFLLPFQNSPSRVLMAATAIAPPLLARLLRRGADRAAPDESALGTMALIGLALCGAGVTVALEGTARQVRLLGASTPLDDTIFGTVFLALATFGGVAFSRSLAQIRNDWGRGRAVEAGLALAALLTLLSQRSLVTISSAGGLRQVMHRYGQETVNYGMFGYDGILAVTIWIAPAFALGAALGCARRSSELTALVCGAALGSLAILLPDAPLHTALITQGILVASAGALIAASMRPRRSGGLPIALALAMVAAGFVAPFAMKPTATMIHAPWERFPVDPDTMFETAEGLITVTPRGADVDVVSLNGVRLTPSQEHATGDRNHIATTVGLLDEIKRVSGFNVLLIGQLTPGRALILTDLGARRIDRTAAWHRSMPLLEERLFGDRGRKLPVGEILTPAAAREQFASFDLVLALPVKGPAPLLPTDFESDEGPLVVLWADAGHGIHRRSLDGPVLLSADGVDELAVAIVYPARPPASGQLSPFEPGLAFDRITAWSDGLVRSARRHELHVTRFTEGLAASNGDTPAGQLAHGMALHFAVQRRSSIFESPEQKIEVSDTALRTLFDALGPNSPPDRLAREVWNGIGLALVAKRDVQAIYEYLEPLATRWAPWPELQLALARADMESLEPADAVKRLQGFEPAPVGLRVEGLEMSARAQAEIDDHAGAAASLRKLAELAPSAWQRRLLGIEATLAGESDGPAILAELLLEDPEDYEIRALVERGIVPETPGMGASGHLNHDE